MNFPPPGDMNLYKGTILTLIAKSISHLTVDYRVTELFGDKNRPCSVDVRGVLNKIDFQPNSELKIIGSQSFYQCSVLKEVDLSNCNKLTTIKDRAFWKCPKMDTLKFPTSPILNKIEVLAFSETGIVDIIIPKEVAVLEGSAFKSCHKMKTFAFEKGSKVTDLPKFLLTGSLVEVFEVKKDVVTIQGGAFQEAMHLLTINVETGNKHFSSITNGLLKDNKIFFAIALGKENEYSVPEGIETIGGLSFYASKITSVTLPSTLVTIENAAFSRSGLTSVNIPPKVTFLGARAFQFCGSLAEVTIQAQITEIKIETFQGCSFKKFIVPDSVISIASNAFSGNSQLQEIVITENCTKFGGNAFPESETLKIVFKEPSELKMTKDFIIMDKKETYIVQYIGFSGEFSPTIPKTIKDIYTSAFEGKQNLIGITFPADSQLTYIYNNAFKNCINLRNLEFPSSLVSIDVNAFMNCHSLENLVFKTNFERGLGYSFMGCANLATVDFSNSKCTVIGVGMFESCPLLSTVTLPAKELSFGDMCFSKCPLLKNINFAEGYSIKTIGNQSFSETQIESFVIPETSTITVIGDKAFYKCTKLSSVTFCSSLTYFGYSAFAFTNISSVELPQKVSYVGDLCFSNSPFITDFIIPEGSLLEEDGLGYTIFRHCPKFTTITLNSDKFDLSTGALFTKGFTKILLFPPNSPIKYFPVPDTVNTIGNGAFIDCCNLETVLIPDKSVHTIGNNAFEGCKSIHYTNIPHYTQFIGQDAYKGCISLECGIDVESTDKNFLERLFTFSQLPRKCINPCVEKTCKKNNLLFNFRNIPLFLFIISCLI